MLFHYRIILLLEFFDKRNLGMIVTQKETHWRTVEHQISNGVVWVWTPMVYECVFDQDTLSTQSNGSSGSFYNI